jgi:hypothetical protein
MKLTSKLQDPAALSPEKAVSIHTEYRLIGAYSQAGHFKDQKNLFNYNGEHAQTC